MSRSRVCRCRRVNWCGDLARAPAAQASSVLGGDAAGQARESGANLAILAELSAEMMTAGSVEQIAVTLAKRAKWIIPNDHCTLLLRNEDRRTWTRYPGGQTGPLSDLPEAITRPLELGQTYVLPAPADPSGAPDPGRVPPPPRHGAVAACMFGPQHLSAVCLPLRGQRETFGTLNFGAREPGVYPRRSSAAVELLRMNVAAVVQSTVRLTQAEKLSELRSRFVATVSHDYKSPLAAILGFTELLLLRGLDLERNRSMLEMIRNETLRLNTMVSEVLDLSRLTLAGAEQRHELLDMPQLVTYCLSTYNMGTADTPLHTFRVDAEPGLPRTYGDPARVTQVLMNLIGNAVKYSPAGGEIIIAMQPDTRREELRVSVADQGMGMEQHEVMLLFQPFQRTRSAIRSGIEGTGLGLAICQEIAQAHGGRLWAESPGTGQGSTFVLALPIRNDSTTNQDDQDGTRARRPV